MVGLDRHPTFMRSMLKTGTAARRIFAMRRTAKRRSAFWLAEGTSHGVFDAEDSLVRFACLTDRSKGGIGWCMIRLQISPANIQLTSVELVANCRLDWSLLKTVVDWFAVSEDAHENGCTFPRLITLSCSSLPSVFHAAYSWPTPIGAV